MLKLTKTFLLFLLCISLKATFAQQTQKIYLSGTDKDHTIDWDFYCTGGRKSNVWTKISVPSCWELQGFGTYNYGHDKIRGKEEGLYKHSFDVPNLNGKKVIITFEGSMTDTEVKINGKLAGPIHQGAFYEFKYDITPLLKQGGSNLLEVKVSKHSANESVNRAERYADFWIFGGIFRPVYLEILPENYISRTAINAKMDGAFNIDIFTTGETKDASVEGQIYTLDGKKVGKSFSAKVNSSVTHINTKINNPTTWNPEKPFLYQVKLNLKNGNKTSHKLTEKFGFRTVELRKKDGFYVNNQKIRFKGVNRHSFYPSSGRTTSKALSIEDVNLMKEMNMNAVRMSHYPPDKHFLEACDSLGLFVLDELTGWQDAYDTEVGKKLVKELVVRDVNHPSIVMWDNGNEGGNNLELVDEYAKYDPQNRTVIHPWEVFNGTDTRHYKPYNCCFDSQFNGDEVFFPTEFQHGLFDGGHGAGLKDYWELMMQKPLSAGGFMWDFADEAVVRTDKNGILDADGTHAPDGIVGPYHEKEGSFYTIKEVWSPVFINQKFITPQFNGIIQIENRYHFTNLDECKFTYSLKKFNNPIEKSIVSEQAFAIDNISVKPGERGALNLSLPANWQSYDALYLTATDPQGKEIYTWTWAIKTQTEIASSILKNTVDLPAVEAKEDANTISLSANNISITCDKNTGTISEVKNNGKLISFSNGPLPAGFTATLKNIKHFADGKDQVITVEFNEGFKRLEFRMQPNGWLKMDYEYLPTEEGSLEFDYAGVNFSYPENKITGVEFLGNGPYRVWKNRMEGVKLGVWDKTYNNTMTGVTWEYPEFKGYYSDFYWATFKNKETPFTVVSADKNLFLRLYTPQIPQGLIDTRKGMMERTHPPFPAGDISFMHAIPAIGDKFMFADQKGPSGQKNMYSKAKRPINLKGTLYFYFGEL